MIIYRWCLASLLIFSWAFPAVFAIPLFVAYGKFPAIGLVWIFAQDPMRTVAEFVLTSAEHPSTKVKRRLAHISGQSNKHFLFPVFWCGTKIIQNHPRSSTIIQYHPRPSKFIQDHPNSSRIIQDLVFRCGRRRGVIGGCGNCQRSLLSSLIQVPPTFWHHFMWTITLIMINTDQPLNNKQIVLMGS